MRVFGALLLSLLLLASEAQAQGTGPCTTTVTTSDTSSNIQNIISTANPGDIVCFSAGSYTLPAQPFIITINALTVRGPNFDVSAISDTRDHLDSDTEAILQNGGATSGYFDIRASDVIISGFSFSQTSASAITTDGASTLSNLRILNNFFQSHEPSAIVLTSTDVVFITGNSFTGPIRFKVKLVFHYSPSFASCDV
eukprot:TRINITY_DN4_c0_g1_i1.p1 TRINITY_DN4_c0_g1~~TRINITY_DN4_c0_g1_i1.p1  ORF type:complete len:197 (-),score=35.51 TRINITY_DN4_c0_g1_i1:197-787(-)